MARRSSVRYWASRGAYCCEHKGRQHTLAVGPDDSPGGPTFAAACKAHAALICGTPSGPTFGALCGEYLEWHKREFQGETVTTVRDRLEPIKLAFFDRPASELTGPLLEAWGAEQREKRGWSSTTVRLSLKSANAALRHAVRARRIAVNPVLGIRLPPDGVRGEEVVLTPAEEERVFQHARGALRDACIFLSETGCRPGEMMNAEARHFRPDLRAIVFPARSNNGPTHKTARRTGKPRIIYLRSQSLALVQRLLEEFPSGPLLRSIRRHRAGPHKGHRWKWTRDGLGAAIVRLRERAGVPHLIPYSFRHTFAVRWVRAGKPFEPLAEILGTSIKMIVDHYGHLAGQTDYLRGLVDGIDGEAKR